MKPSIMFLLIFLIVSPAQAAKSDPFACTLTQMIESIDGSMHARNRTRLLKKSLPTQGYGRFEEVYSDPADPAGKKFRIEAQLERGRQGQWVIQQQLYQVLSDGEREGKELDKRTVALEILRTTEQVYRGMPKTEYRLQCAIKPSEIEPLFAHNLEMELKVDAEGESVDISKRKKMAGIAIPYSPLFIQKNAKLDPKIFNREVDPDPQLAEKPTTAVVELKHPTHVLAVDKSAAETTWRDVWPFRLIKKPAPPVQLTHRSVQNAPVQLESSKVERAYRAKVPPSFMRSSYVARAQPVPLVLSPKNFKKVWTNYVRTQPNRMVSNRKPASEKEYTGIRPSMVNGVPSIPTPLIRIWSQFK